MWIYKYFSGTITIPSNDVNIPHIAANDVAWGIIVRTVFIAIGALSVLYLVIGGIMYITSNGNQSQIQRAKDAILYAIVGIVVSALAFTIVQFVLGWIYG